MKTSFYPLRVAHLARPTRDAVTLTFEAPGDARELFRYRSGQHLVLRFVIDGREARRTYSLNSSPVLAEPLQITVKRVPGGLVSNFVNDRLKAGDTLEAMPPSGRFCITTEPTHYKSYYLFTAGSGITPLFSILKSVLHGEPHSAVYCLYGNRNRSSILFLDALEDLQERFADRLTVHHVLSAPYSDWSSIWGYDGRQGRIDRQAVEWFIQHCPPRAQTTEYFICGPGDMNRTVREALRGLGVPAALIHNEHFGAPASTGEATGEAVCDRARLRAKLGGAVVETTIARGRTVLQALRDAGHEPPYSCEAGVCSTCVARLAAGTVRMKAHMALTEQEVAAGLVLTCQALPTSPQVELDYDA